MPQFQEGLPRPEGAGRKAGTPNRITQLSRDTLTAIIAGNADKLQGWLDEIYTKHGALAAFKCYSGLLEYAVPKMARTEIIQDEPEPKQIIEVKFV